MVTQQPNHSAAPSHQVGPSSSMLQPLNQVLNAAQYQPPSASIAQHQVTFQPPISSAVLSQPSAGNVFMQKVPHQVLNAAQYQQPSYGMSYSQGVHQQPSSVAAPGHQTASGIMAEPLYPLSDPISVTYVAQYQVSHFGTSQHQVPPRIFDCLRTNILARYSLAGIVSAFCHRCCCWAASRIVRS